jgi:hypothetical protein
VPIVLKSGNLNPLETYGIVQACNGIALPLFINRNFLHEVTARTINAVAFTKRSQADYFLTSTEAIPRQFGYVS